MNTINEELNQHIPINDINDIIIGYSNDLTATDTAVRKFRSKLHSLMKRTILDKILPVYYRKRIKTKVSIETEIREYLFSSHTSINFFITIYIDGIKNNMKYPLFTMMTCGSLTNFNGLNASIYDKNVRPISKYYKDNETGRDFINMVVWYINQQL